jgi:hypothetical protein
MKIIEGMPSEFELEKIHQVVAMFKREWPHGFQGDNSLRDWIHPECDSPYYLMSCNMEKVLAHVSILNRIFKDSVGRDVCIQGLSGVITQQESRGQGLGALLVERASQKIFTSLKADLGMFNCNYSHVKFYEKQGWLELKNLKLEFGENEPYECCDEATMYRVLSEKGKSFLEAQIKTGPFYFGKYLW